MDEKIPMASRPVGTALLALISAKRQEIDDTCARFVTIGNPESLHDLRVALRRLHSLFIGFSPCLRNDTPLAKSLRGLFKQTNHARDLEVTLALLSRREINLPWLQRQWQHELDSEYRRLRERLPPAWQALSLQFATPAKLLAESPAPMSLSRFAAGEIEHQGRQLLKRIRRLMHQWQDKRAHKLRIRAKRLRYLLEPLADGAPATAKAVERLKRFQDRFGDDHDLMVLIERLKRLRRDATLNQYEMLSGAIGQLKRERRQQRRTLRRDYAGKAWRKLDKALRVARRELAEPVKLAAK
jgi:CHAD domain-containing protein